MKIMLINDYSKEGGGAETYIFAISKLLGKKHDITFFSYGNTDIRENNRVIVAHSANRLKKKANKFSFNFKVYSELKKFIRRVNPDIIFMHNNFTYSLPVLAALYLTKVPVVQTIHDWGQICPSSWCVIKKNFKRCEGVEGIACKCPLNGCISTRHFVLAYMRNKLRIKLTKKIVRQFISPSKMLAEDLIRHGFKNTRCIHNFMEFGNAKMNFNNSQKGKVIYVGMLGKNKGVEFLITAFKQVLEQYPKAFLKIIGDGPERDNLEKLARDLNIQNKIEFTGKIPHEAVIREFERTRLFVIPSVWMENSPFVIYECMSAGRPIVGSARGGIPDLVLDKKTGFLVEPANPGQICEAILKILKDDKLFKKMGKNAFNYVHSDLNSKVHIKAVEKVLNKAVKSPH